MTKFKSKQQKTEDTTSIKKAILDRIGRPRNFHKLIVKHLWDDRYRANVFVQHGIELLISDSFFIRASKSGEIYNSKPELTRKYNE